MMQVGDEKEREGQATVTGSDATPTQATEAGGQEPRAAQGHAAGTGAGDEPPAGAVGAPAGANMPQLEEMMVTLEPGRIVKGKVVHVGADEVLVDVGYKTEGRIPLHELGLRAGQRPEDVLSVGDEIDVCVIKVEDAEGNVLLSKRRADSRVVWERLERLHAAGEPIEAKVTERVKGGLLVDVGVRGFVPASHVARNYVENLDKFVGETLRFKIIELDRRRNNVVLSRKELLEEEYQKAKDEIFNTLKEGQIVEGVVRRLTDFGAFIDIGGGVEGLLHVSEMAWSRVRHPSDVLSEGQRVRLMVLSVDRERERISLSLKETLPDPWDTVAERYHVGDVVEGEVTRVVDFGAFVKLEDGVEGLVHVSQLADRHVANPSEVVQPGQRVKVKVISLDEKARRIGLSMRDAQPRERRPERHVDPQRETVKLGDVFEDLSQFFADEEEEESQRRRRR